MPTIISAFHKSRLAEFNAHLQRHRKESGINGFHYMPFDPSDKQGPKGIEPGKIESPINATGWERAFVLSHNTSNNIIGHVILKGNLLNSSLHRCWLELGIESEWREQGLGTHLMRTAIDFVKSQDSLEWIDLYTFSQNTPALNLYKKIGFQTIGTMKDRFRIADTSIDDVMMTLNIRN